MSGLSATPEGLPEGWVLAGAGPGSVLVRPRADAGRLRTSAILSRGVLAAGSTLESLGEAAARHRGRHGDLDRIGPVVDDDGRTRLVVWVLRFSGGAEAPDVVQVVAHAACSAPADTAADAVPADTAPADAVPADTAADAGTKAPVAVAEVVLTCAADALVDHEVAAIGLLGAIRTWVAPDP